MTEIQGQQIDELLRREFNAALPDDGFSNRVLSALPSRPRSRRWIAPAALLAGAISTLASLWPAPLWQLASNEWARGSPGTMMALTLALGLAAGLMACTWALVETD